MMGQMHGPGPNDFLAVADQAGVVVRPGAGFPVWRARPFRCAEAGIPIDVNGQQVGTLLEGRPSFASLPTAGQDFLRQVNLALSSPHWRRPGSPWCSGSCSHGR